MAWVLRDAAMPHPMRLRDPARPLDPIGHAGGARLWRRQIETRLGRRRLQHLARRWCSRSDLSRIGLATPGARKTRAVGSDDPGGYVLGALFRWSGRQDCTGPHGGRGRDGAGGHPSPGPWRHTDGSSRGRCRVMGVFASPLRLPGAPRRFTGPRGGGLGAPRFPLAATIHPGAGSFCPDSASACWRSAVRRRRRARRGVPNGSRGVVARAASPPSRPRHHSYHHEPMQAVSPSPWRRFAGVKRPGSRVARSCMNCGAPPSASSAVAVDTVRDKQRRVRKWASARRRRRTVEGAARGGVPGAADPSSAAGRSGRAAAKGMRARQRPAVWGRPRSTRARRWRTYWPHGPSARAPAAIASDRCPRRPDGRRASATTRRKKMPGRRTLVSAPPHAGPPPRTSSAGTVADSEPRNRNETRPTG